MAAISSKAAAGGPGPSTGWRWHQQQALAMQHEDPFGARRRPPTGQDASCRNMYYEASRFGFRT